MNDRPAALAPGPVSLLALLLFVTAAVVEGFESDLALARSPIASASSVAGLIGLILLVIALVGMAQRFASLQAGVGRVGVGIALVGTLLSIGGQWSTVFVVPGLARMDDATAEATTSGIPLVVAGFIASFLVLALGWILIAVALLKDEGVPRWAGVFLLVAAVICIVPLPARFFLIAVAVSMIEGRVASRSLRVQPMRFQSAGPAEPAV